ncbi:MAG: GWxTD domain-containing protein [Bacteroidetes bacterium]|nr:GWxTD domain-containing protein [Bacteroidota bacterium]
MKNFALISLFLFMLIPSEMLFAQTIVAQVSHAEFYSVENGPYLELYFSIEGGSLTYVQNDNSKFQAGAEILYMLREGDSVRTFDKYLLKSPEAEDSSGVWLNLIDVKRSLIAPGNYTLEVTIRDINKEENEFSTIREITISKPSDRISFSDIQLLDRVTQTTIDNNFSKNNMEMIPYVINFFPTNKDELMFYVEVYNNHFLRDGEKFLLYASIRDYDQKVITGPLNTTSIMTAQPVNILLQRFNIRDLPSGNYYIVVEARDQQNKLISEQNLFFQRSNTNPIAADSYLFLMDIANTFVDTISNYRLEYLLNAVRPIATFNEEIAMDNSIERNDPLLMKQFLLNFWIGQNITEPGITFEGYMKVVEVVNNRFGTQMKYGFDTDRGRVYLKYGPPREMLIQHHESGMKPFELWQYYTLLDQRNVKFVFFNQDLVTNDFILIHSDLRGEVHNPEWKARVAD